MSETSLRNAELREERLTRAERRLGYVFGRRGLLAEALRHSSAASGDRASNERLEFLGDAVIDLVVAEELYARHPDRPEGELSPMKSAAVSRESCAAAAAGLGLAELLKVGPGMARRGGPAATLAGNAFEAVVAAIYLDDGLETARGFVLKHLGSAIDTAGVSAHHRNFKSALQDFAQAWLGGRALYEPLGTRGPKHRPVFEVSAVVNERMFPAASAASKKKAEQAAAEAALLTLREESGDLPKGARKQLDELLGESTDRGPRH